MRIIPKLRICHIVAQKDPGAIVGTRKIIATNHGRNTEEDVEGNGGSDDDKENDDNNDDDKVEVKVEVVEHVTDIAVPNRETQIVEIDIEEDEEVDDFGVAENAKKGLLQSSLHFFMQNNLMVQDLKTNRKVQEKLFNHMCR